jgi:hypothetical protein
VKTQDSKHSWFTPLMRFSIQLPLLSLGSVSILSGCPIINIRSCHEDMKLSWIGPMSYHPHPRFHSSKPLTHLSYDYGTFNSISGIDLDVSNYRKINV